MAFNIDISKLIYPNYYELRDNKQRNYDDDFAENIYIIPYSLTNSIQYKTDRCRTM